MENIINSDIRNRISELLVSPEGIELEARFTDYHLKKGVDKRTFKRLHDYLNKYKTNNYVSTDYTVTETRLRITQLLIPSQEPQVLVIKKEELLSEIIESFNFKIAVSRETRVRITEENIKSLNEARKIKNGILTRINDRTSYFLSDNIRVDLTKVSETNDSIQTFKNEVEVELLKPEGLSEWYNSLLLILRIMQNTDITYTIYEYKNLLSTINTKLGNPNERHPNINSKCLMDARNLKFQDIVYGGLVGNPKVSYRVTVKSDGERKLLVIDKGSVYLVWNNEVNKIYTDKNLIAVYDGYIFDGELIKGGIMDSQLKTSISEKYWYLIFDLICYNNGGILDQSIRDRHHEQRMLVAQVFKDRVFVEGEVQFRQLINIIKINTKQFYNIKTLTEFYGNMKLVNDDRSGVDYAEDGFIFVPNEAPYKRNTEPRRVLTESADICKLKYPVSLYTIDAAILRIASPNGEEIVAQGLDKKKLSILFQYNVKTRSPVTDPILAGLLLNVPLVGKQINNISYRYPKVLETDSLSDSVVKFSWDSNRNIYIGEKDINARMTPLELLESKIVSRSTFIIGIGWDNIESNIKIMRIYHQSIYDQDAPYRNYVTLKDKVNYNQILAGLPSGYIVEFTWDPQNETLTPLRPRHNKLVPNNVETIKDNKFAIIDSIELKTMLGENMQLERKYHNVIKNSLFSEFLAESVLDLGSGNGGDLRKMMKYKKILLVEPDPEHVKELVRRAKQIFELPEIRVIKQASDFVESDVRNRILVIESKAENWELITDISHKYFGGRCDVISMMLSLSFFWRDEATLKSLIETIDRNLKVGGNFIYLTIDGDKTIQYFDPLVKGAKVPELSLFNGDAVIRYLPNSKEVKVRFKGTIVEKGDQEQTEYLVMLNDLRSYFLNIGIHEIKYESANKEQFLNNSEKVLTSLYSYGAFTRKSLTESSIDYKSPYLVRGKPVDTSFAKVDDKSSNIVYTGVKAACKWYKGNLYRYGQLKFKDQFLILLSCVLRAIKQSQFPTTINDIITLVNDEASKFRKAYPFTEVNSLVITNLGKFYSVDVSLLELSDTNIVPSVTKIGNFPAVILIGKSNNGYENIVEKLDTGIRFLFGSTQMESITYSLYYITLLSKLNTENSKVYSNKYIEVLNGKINWDLLKAMLAIISKGS